MNTNQTVRVTGNQLPAYFLGRHRSVYIQAYARKAQPEPSRPAPQPMPIPIRTPETEAVDEELLVGITA